MIDFQNVELMDEAGSFVMPAAESHYLTQRMREAGIHLEYYSWREVLRGQAPLGYEEALDALRPFEEEGSFSAAPCVIVSRVSPGDMQECALSMVRPPLDPDYAVFESAHAEMDEVTVPELGGMRDEVMCDELQFDEPMDGEAVEDGVLDDLDLESLIEELGLEAAAKDAEGKAHCLIRSPSFRRGWLHGDIDPADVQLAVRVVHGVADGAFAGLRLQSRDGRGDLGRVLAPVGASLRKQVGDTLFPGWEGRCEGYFSDWGQAGFMLEEAVASMSLEIAQWANGNLRWLRDDDVAHMYFEVDPLNYGVPEEMSFTGVVGDAQSGNVRHMSTSSVRVTLARDGDSPFGFDVRRIEPDFGTPTAKLTGINLRECARELLREHRVRKTWNGDHISHAVMEYRFDSNREVNVGMGVEWIAEQDKEYFAVVEVPIANPAVSQAVYVMWDGTYLVTGAGPAPARFEYFPRLHCSGLKGESWVEYLPSSDAPNAKIYDHCVRLEDPGVFEAFRSAHPDVADVVADLCRTASSYRIDWEAADEESAGPEDGARCLWQLKEPSEPWISVDEWRRQREGRPHSPWHADSTVPLDCVEGSSALRAIGNGVDVFESRVPKSSRLS